MISGPFYYRYVFTTFKTTFLFGCSYTVGFLEFKLLNASVTYLADEPLRYCNEVCSLVFVCICVLELYPPLLESYIVIWSYVALLLMIVCADCCF